MASQPPVQYNQISPTIPNVTGFPRPPLLQQPASNGLGQPSSGPTFPSTANFAPVSSNAEISQWARPPSTGQGPTFSPVNQTPASTMNQQFNPIAYGQNLPRPPIQATNSVRTPVNPGTTVTSGTIPNLKR